MKMSNIIRFVFLSFVFVSTVKATTFSRLSVEEVFKYSSFVGIVEIKKGSTLGTPEQPCGALYEARVIEQFKGKSLNSINFGYAHGYGVGDKYLLFLNSRIGEKRFLNSTNSNSEAARQEFFDVCEKHLPEFSVSHSGIAIIEYRWTSEFKYKDSFAVPTRYIQFPDTIEAKEGNFDGNYEFHDMKWLLEDGVIEHMRKLATDDS